MRGREIYIEKIEPFIDSPLVKILTGVRRCGKSSILKLFEQKLIERGIEKNQIIMFNFDSLKYPWLNNYKALYDEVAKSLNKQAKTYLLLDEIQEVEDWERAINSLMVDFDIDIYITGSNSRLLSSEISSHLTGRYISIPVFPLSFKEYLDFTSSYRALKGMPDEFMLYLKKGGFPSLHLREYDDSSAYTIVKDIYNSTIFTDIVQRSNLRNIEQFERVVNFVFDNVGKTFSAKSISDYLKSQQRKGDVESIYNYLSMLEKAFIVYKAKRYDIKGKEILKTQEKFFLADPALKYAVLGYQPSSVAAMLENIVFLELKRRGYEVYVGKLNDKEIDFVAIRQEKRLYVQVSLSILDPATFERELFPLTKIKDNYQKLLLTLDNSPFSGVHNGIIIQNIVDFLLSNDK